jgi:hypothetical protein
VSLWRDTSTKIAVKRAAVAMRALPDFGEPGIEAKIAEFLAPHNPGELDKHVKTFHSKNKGDGLSKSKSKSKKSKSKSKTKKSRKS